MKRYEIISAYYSLIANPDHVWVEVHSPAYSQHHNGTLKSAKELAIKLNEERKQNAKRSPENRRVLSGDFFYLRRGNKSTDVGYGIGDEGQTHRDWAQSQQAGHQLSLL